MPPGHATELSAEEKQRYARQMLIPRWGEETQRRLKAAKVFIAGAGGPGSPASVNLAVAGIGLIRKEAPPKEVFPVLGATSGITGTIQAMEAIKYLAGVGRLLKGRLLCCDYLEMRFFEVKMPKDPPLHRVRVHLTGIGPRLGTPTAPGSRLPLLHAPFP